MADFIGSQRACHTEALLLPEFVGEGADGGGNVEMDEIDPLFVDSIVVVTNQQGSAVIATKTENWIQSLAELLINSKVLELLDLFKRYK